MRCAISGSEFSLTPLAQEVINEIGCPLPRLSFAESTRIKIAHRNHLHLYKRNCDYSGKSILSNIPPSSGFRVYDKEVWFSDAWSALEYHRPYISDESFFEQLHRLQKEVPMFNLQNMESENCDYCNSIKHAKDCYLAFSAYYNCRDVYYSFSVLGGKDIYFCAYIRDSENCYFSNNLKNCHSCIGCETCFNSSNCLYSACLDNCQDCLFCHNLQHKQHYIYNRQVTKDEFNAFKRGLHLTSLKAFKSCIGKLDEIKRATTWKANQIINCEDCSGDDLIRCKLCENVYASLDTEKAVDAIYSSGGGYCIYRCYGGGDHGRFNYETSATTNASNCSFGMYVYNSSRCEYCINVHNCQNCFGCVGLRNAQYCILNTPYPKEEYEKLRQSIIGNMQRRLIADASYKEAVPEWGQYLPVKYSPFPYNHSLAQMFYPLTRDAAIRRGYIWQDEEIPQLSEHEVYRYPDEIGEWDDRLEGKTLRCEKSGKTFNLNPKVIKRLKSEGLGLSIEHPIDFLMRVAGAKRYTLTRRISCVSNKEVFSPLREDEAPRVCSLEEYEAER